MKKMHLVRSISYYNNGIMALQLNKLNKIFFLDMRKPLPRDEKRESVIENGENNIVKPEDL